jgi:LysW-gamma-L-lysine carboxypeptidase
VNPIELLKKAVEMYTPPGQEKALSEFLLLCSENKGAVDDAGNFIIEKGSGKTLLLCSHMDTVEGVIPVKILGNRLYGRGAVDAKGPLISMFVAFMQTDVKNIRLVFAGVVKEEGDSAGIKHLMKYMDSDYAVFGEPSGLNKITIGYKGSAVVKKKFEARPGHIANPETENAIENALDFIKKTSSHNRIGYGHFTFRPLSVRGNAKECELSLNVRIPLNRTKKDVKELLGKCEFLEWTPPFETDMKSPIILAMKKAVKAVTGSGARLSRKSGTADMNIYSEVCKNCITYGPGNSRLDHTDNEYIDLKEFMTSIEVYKRFIHTIDGQH